MSLSYTWSMCQSLAQGGRRCPAHQPATLGIKDYCRTLFGLTSGQVDHTFRRLRREGNQRPAPSEAEYAHLVSRAKEVAERNVSDATALARINRQLDKTLTADQLPDGATFYALKKLVARSREQKAEFVDIIRRYSQSNGISRNEAYRRFQQHYSELETGAGSSMFSDTFDARTRQALSLMNNDPVNTDVVSTTPRIETTEATSDSRVTYGYDPDDGRTEIHMEGMLSNYAYHNVSPEMVERLRANPYETLAHFDNNPFYHYATIEESEADRFGRWCTECHSYRAASGHVCEPVEESDDMLEVGTEETPLVESPTAEMSLEAAQQRIRMALRERDGAPLPSRPATRMTARRRTWTSPLDSREEVTLESTIRGNARGGRTYSAPDPQEVKRLALQGKVVMVEFNRHTVSNSYAREYGASPEVMMTHTLKFYCNDITGDVKMERVGNARCDCEEYQARYTCRHVVASDGSGNLNRHFNGDMEDYFTKVDQMSKLRQDAASGRFILTESGTRTTYDDFEGDRVEVILPNRTVLGRAQQILADGGSVQVTRQNFSGYIGGNYVTGSLKFEGSTDNIGIHAINEMRCSRCQQTPCEHGEKLARYFSTKIMPPNAVLATSASRLQQLDSIENSDWQSNNEDVQSVLSTFAPGIDRSYTANLGQYLEDYREAREKVRNGESPLPYATENVTNGVCAPGQKAFGIEIEFDLARGSSRYALEDIAREMYESGLSEYPEMQRWHYNARTATPYSHWSLERDSTVAGEIVSPILHDTPETWEQISKICEIVKRHGGVASVNAGQHVHMGTVNRTGSQRRNRDTALAEKNASILKFYAANEDSIRRIQTDPARKSHRNTRYCSPLAQESIQNSLYHFRSGYVNLGSNHDSSVNFGFNDRIEFRGADASLDPAHIQAQVMLCAGIVAAAERGDLDEGPNYENLKHQRVGTNARRLNAIRLSDQGEELTDDEVIVSDASFRNFITSMFDTDHGRKMMVAIAANTPWQQ